MPPGPWNSGDVTTAGPPGGCSHLLPLSAGRKQGRPAGAPEAGPATRVSSASGMLSPQVRCPPPAPRRGSARQDPRALWLAAGLKQPRILCQEPNSILASRLPKDAGSWGRTGLGEETGTSTTVPFVSVTSLQDDASGSKSLPSFPTIPGSHLFLQLHSPQGDIHWPVL